MFQIGIIGMGGIGVHLGREVAEHPDAAIAAVVDVNPQNLDRAAREFDLDESVLFEDTEAMYATAALDAVVIATPPGLHYDQICEAFERDLHVLCEKPVVVDTEEARDVVERVNAGSNVLMACYQRHLNPGFIEAWERWHETHREPTFITGELTQDWTHHYREGSNWRMDPELGGGGHLFSVGTHVVESVLWLTGLAPESVSAEMVFHDDAQRIDKQASLNVTFENGAVASLADSGVAPATREHIHIWDDDGAVYLEGADWTQRELTLVDADGTERKPDLAYENARTKVEAFLEAVETGTEPPATANDALRVTALLEAAYDSARTGERVDVDY